MEQESLHARYAPIMHYSSGERFFPMSAEDFLSYAALYARESGQPLVTQGRARPEDLLRAQRNGSETFLRSVSRGPLQGRDVASTWSRETLQLLARCAQSSPLSWSDDVARAVYEWFGPKTAAATRLFWWNSLILQRDVSQGRTALPRFRLPGETRLSALEHYNAFAGGHAPETYYYRIASQGRYMNLQYWFFYAYNDWANTFDGFNDHEGDWEGVQLFFALDGGRPAQEPAYICYLGHSSRITKPWHHPEVYRSGTHPHVYVAAGSHASYPEPKAYSIMALYNLIDRATGEERTLDASDWRRALDLDRSPWVLDYRGSWGTRYWLSMGALHGLLQRLGVTVERQIALPGVSAPRCPRYDEEGVERATWADAVTFAGIPDA